MTNPDKKDGERAVRKTVSMPGMMLGEARTRQRQYKLTTFSDYVQLLIRKDTQQEQARA